MHGGGGAPKQVNDSQWRQMQKYYRDHPEAGGYLYLALRAPNDEWNGFYADYVYPLIDELIRQFRLFGDIDPNKVFIMGYSHGGYGAYAIGPEDAGPLRRHPCQRRGGNGRRNHTQNASHHSVHSDGR